MVAGIAGLPECRQAVLLARKKSLGVASFKNFLFIIAVR